MPVAQYQYHFAQGAASWTETIYDLSADDNPDTNYPRALVLAEDRVRLLPNPPALIAPDRIATRGAVPRMQGVTISRVPRRRQAALFPLPLSPPAGNPATGGSGLRGAKITMYTAGRAHRRIFTVRGIPSTWTSFDLDDNLTGVIRVAAFRGYLKSLIQVLANSPLVADPNKPLVAMRVPIYQAAPGGSQITKVHVTAQRTWELTVPGTTVAVGTRVKIAGLRGPSTVGLNGTTVVIGRAGNVVRIAKVPCRLCGDGLTRTGFLSVLVNADAYLPVAEAVFTGWTDHKTGGPFDATSGRTRRCCP